MLNHFADTQTIERIKNRYATLAAFMHPSAGGSATDYAELERQYLEALKALHGYVEKGDDGKERQYKFDADIEKGLADKIGDILSLKMGSAVKVCLIGTWIWVRGETKPFAPKLGKAGLGMRWSADKESWYFHFGAYRKRSGKTASFEGMARKYGYREFSEDNA
jgi:hypothetical protein